MHVATTKITQRILVSVNRRIGTAYLSHLQGSSSSRRPKVSTTSTQRRKPEICHADVTFCPDNFFNVLLTVRRDLSVQ